MPYFYNSKKTHYVYPEKHERDLKNKESATNKKNKYQNSFNRVLTDIRSIIGEKEFGTYTANDALKYIRKKYSPKVLSAYDFCDILYAERGAKKQRFPISYILDDYHYSDTDCIAVYLFPTKEPLNERYGDDAVILMLEAKNDRISNYYFGPNTVDYDDLFTALQIFKGKTPEEYSLFIDKNYQ